MILYDIIVVGFNYMLLVYVIEHMILLQHALQLFSVCCLELAFLLALVRYCVYFIATILRSHSLSIFKYSCPYFYDFRTGGAEATIDVEIVIAAP